MIYWFTRIYQVPWKPWKDAVPGGQQFEDLETETAETAAIAMPVDLQPAEELRAEWDMMIKYFGLDVYMCPTVEKMRMMNGLCDFV